jgi:hypothetical protein
MTTTCRHAWRLAVGNSDEISLQRCDLTLAEYEPAVLQSFDEVKEACPSQPDSTANVLAAIHKSCRVYCCRG